MCEFRQPPRLPSAQAPPLVKFSPPGAEVTVTIGDTERDVRISIRDHGPGIPDSHKERIFEKLVQVDATDARTKGGAGLGLSIAKQIVVRLGGEIEVEDAPRWRSELPHHPSEAARQC